MQGCSRKRSRYYLSLFNGVDDMAVLPGPLFKALLEDVTQDLPPGYKAGTGWSPDMSPREVAASNLVESFLKKYLPSDRTTAEQDKVATEKFIATNIRCSEWTYSPCTSGDEELMGEFKQLIYKFFYPSGTDSLITGFPQIFEEGRNGPGAAVGALGTDFYTKSFSSPLLCTSTFPKDAFYASIQNDFNNSWNTAEQYRESVYGEVGFCEGSRFHFVPKNDRTSRLIAIEPSLNMFYQLGLGRIIERGLFHTYGLRLDAQPQINRYLAWVGSVTDDLCTIDLSNASDSLGLPMLRWALPPPVMAYLMRLRSPTGELMGERVTLHMVSTMGNGYTFPLETLVFVCIVLSAIRSHRIFPVRPYRDLDLAVQFSKIWDSKQFVPSIPELAQRHGTWGVFGDDLICHREVVGRVLRLLTLLGFEVNREKTFVEGPFRESCGRDFYKGHDVRGVYLKRLDTVASRYVAINALNVWSAKTGIALVKVIQMLMDSIPEDRRFLIPPEDNHDAGIRVPFSFIREVLPRNANQSVIYNRSVSKPAALRIGDGEVRVPRGARNRCYNPEGLLQSYLGGYVKQGRIVVRQTKVRYRTKRGVTPRWDYVPPTCDIASLCGFPRWESAVEVNLQK